MKYLIFAILLTMVIVEHAFPLDEIWISGAIRQNAEQRSEWEIATGFAKNQILYERELNPTGMKMGWGYNINIERKKTWTRIAFADIYRQTQNISLQAQSFTAGKDSRAGLAITGENYSDWTLMGVIEVDYQQGWINLSTNYMTDLSAFRWSMIGNLAIPISERMTFGPTLNYHGTESLTIGRGKLKVTYKF